MKRWAWLLVLPYAVVTTKHCMGKDDCWVENAVEYTKPDKTGGQTIFKDLLEEPAEDMAAALNAAHERRTQKPLGIKLDGISTLHNKEWCESQAWCEWHSDMCFCTTKDIISGWPDGKAIDDNMPIK